MARKVFIGQKTKAHINTQGLGVGTSVVQLSTSGRKLEGGVQIVAAAGNGGIVYVGVRSNLTAGTSDETDGFPLSAGESLFLPVASEDEVYCIATAITQQVHFVSF